jgi:hypothetical protein
MTKRVRKTKEETSNEIWEAIKLIEDGKANNLAELPCKKLSIKNVCLQANVSRPTLYSYTDIKKYISDNSPKNNKESEYKATIAKLEEEKIEMKDYIKQLENERDAALIEQHNTIEKLKNKNKVISIK